MKLNDFIKEYKFIEGDIKKLFMRRIKSLGGLFHVLSGKKEIPFDLKFSIIIDDFSDPAGLLIIGKKIESFKNFIIRYHVTKREAQIIEEIISGKYQTEIADKLKITIYTLKRHVTNIYNKLGVNNKVQLMNLFKEVHVLSEHSISKNKIFPRK